MTFITVVKQSTFSNPNVGVDLLGTFNGLLNGNVDGASFVNTANLTASGQVSVDTIIEYSMDSGVTVDGVLLKDGNVTATIINTTDILVTGNVDADNVNVTNLITATDATLSGDLTAVGGTFSANVDADNVNVTNLITATDATLSGDLSAVGGTFSANVDADNVNVTNLITATDATLSGDLSAVGGTFSANVDADNVNVTNLITATDATLSGDLNAVNSTLSGDLSAVGGTFSGNVSADNLTVTNLITATDFTTSSDICVGGTLQADTIESKTGGDITINDDVAMGSGYTITGDEILTDAITSATASGGDIAVDANFIPQGDQFLGSAVSPWKTIYGQDIEASGDLSVAGDLTVSGNVTYVSTTNLIVEDNKIFINSPPSTMGWDSGLNISRFQNIGDTGDATGDVVQDTPFETGNALGGTVSTLEIANSVGTSDTEYYDGWYVKIISGTNAGEVREVDSFNGTDTLTLTTDFGSAIDVTSVYGLYPCKNIFMHWDESANKVVFSCTGNVDPTDNANIAPFIDSMGNRLDLVDLCVGDITAWDTLPAKDLSYDLGSPSKQWNTVYAETFSGSIDITGDLDMECNSIGNVNILDVATITASMCGDGNISVSDTIKMNSNDILGVNEITSVTGTFSGDITAVNGTFSGNADANNVNATNLITATDAILSGDLSAVNTTLTGDLTAVNGTFSGNADANNVNVTNLITATDATLSGDLAAVNGTFSGNADANNVNVTNLITATDATLTGDLTAVNGTFSGNADADNVNVTNLITATDATLSGDLIAVNGTFSGNADADNVNVTNLITATDATLSGDLIAVNGTFSGNADADNVNVTNLITATDATLSGDLIAVNGTFSGNADADNVNVTNLITATDATLSGDLTAVNGTFSGNADADNVNVTNLITATDATLSGDLIAVNGTFSGNADADNVNVTNLITATDATLSGDLTAVNGTFSGTIDVTGETTMNGDVLIDADANITGELTVGSLSLTGGIDMACNDVSNVNVLDVTTITSSTTCGGDGNISMTTGLKMNSNDILGVNDLTAVSGTYSGNVDADNVNSTNLITATDAVLSGDLTAVGATFSANIVTRTILPAVDDLYTLGSPDFQWANIYATSFTGEFVVEGDLDLLCYDLENANIVDVAILTSSGTCGNDGNISVTTGFKMNSNDILGVKDLTALSGTYSGNVDADNVNVTNLITATDATLSGDLTAVNGTFSGNADADNVNVTNLITATDATLSGDLTAVNGTFSGNADADNVNVTNLITATDATLSGDLTAVNGTFSGNADADNVNVTNLITATDATLSGDLTAVNAYLSGTIQNSAWNDGNVGFAKIDETGNIIKDNGDIVIIGDLDMGCNDIANVASLFVGNVYPSETCADSTITMEGNVTVNGCFKADVIEYEYTEVTNSYTVTETDDIIACNTQVGAITITLPEISTLTMCNKKMQFAVVDVGGNSGMNNITISATGSDLILGGSDVILSGNYNAIHIFSDMVSGWFMY
jgi:trimeric autotransporter adhesin